jgi:prepilin-type N-terminal cleavage/methylation domain-containing protein
MNRRNPGGRVRGAFTLVELLVVMGIIGILIGLLLPAVTQAIAAGRVAATSHTIMGLGEAIDSFKKDWSFYPPSDNTHEVKIGYPRYGYECLVYYLMGPNQTGWGGANVTGTAGQALNLAPNGGIATKAYPPYFVPDRSGDIMIVDTEDYYIPSGPSKNDIHTSLSIQDAFNPAKRILYYRYEPASSPPYNANSGADIKAELPPPDTIHAPQLGDGSISGTHTALGCVLSFASQPHFELLVRPNGKWWVRQDYLLISCGADRYWGWVKQDKTSAGYTGRMAPAIPTSSVPYPYTDSYCDDICNFSY